MRTLIFLGAVNLTGENGDIERQQSEGSHSVEVKRVVNARSAGSTVTDSQIREKEITLNGVILDDGNRTIDDLWAEIKQELNKPNRYLRFTKTWYTIYTPTSAELWTLSDDAVNKVSTLVDRFFDAGLMFDLDVSVDADNQATLTYFDGNSVGADLDEFEGTGRIEMPFKLTDVENITGIMLKVGSDASNYLTYTFQAQYDGYQLTEGWNYFSAGWNEFTEVGDIDPNLMGRYIQVQVQYSVNQADATGFVFGGLIWQKEDDARNYVIRDNGATEDEEQGSKTMKEFTLSLLVPKGLGTSTGYKTYFTQAGLAGATNDISATFEGSYDPEPIISLLFSSVTNMDKILITNQKTGDTVTLDETWAVNDLVVVDLEAGQVTRNGALINFESVLPRFLLGKNKINITLTSTSENIQSQTTNNTNLKGEL